MDDVLFKFLQRKMEVGGLAVDNAFVSWQQHLQFHRKRGVFFMNSPQLVQQGELGSDLLALSTDIGGNAGWMRNRSLLTKLSRSRRSWKKNQKKPLTRERRGVKKIPVKIKKATLRVKGQIGGKKLCGNGTSVVDMCKKEKKLKKMYFDKKVFPPFRVAQEELHLGQGAWQRIRKSVLGDTE